MEVKVKVIGKMDNTIDHSFESRNRVYDKSGLCPTIQTCTGGGIQPMIIEDFYANREPRAYERRIEALCTAMRGRGENNEQQLELNTQGVVNALTTVQKDNLVMEKNVVIDIYNNKKIDGDVCGTITANGNTSFSHCGTFGIVEKEKINKVGQISNEGSQCGTVVSDEGLSPTLSAGTHGYANPHVLTRYRIRKLTPKECWRLMGFSDEDFGKAEKVCSSTQLYKQAGNSIVVNVLMAIFSQMNIKGVKPWNEVHNEKK